MSKTINLFMWGYQESFRRELQIRAESIFEKIGCSLKPDVLLVGIRTPEKDKVHPVCVEPEEDKWDPKIFFGCKSRADEIFQNHPDHKTIFGDAPRMEDQPENIRLKSTMEAVKEVIEQYDNKNNTISFCSYPTRKDGYFIVPILQFDKTKFEIYPTIKKPIQFDRFRPSSRGLQFSIIDNILKEATDGLVHKDPGRFFKMLFTDSTTILRESARELCSAIAMSTQDFQLSDVFDKLNDIAELSYEGSSASGTLYFEPIKNSGCDIKINMINPVSLNEHKLRNLSIKMRHIS